VLFPPTPQTPRQVPSLPIHLEHFSLCLPSCHSLRIFTSLPLERRDPDGYWFFPRTLAPFPASPSQRVSSLAHTICRHIQKMVLFSRRPLPFPPMAFELSVSGFPWLFLWLSIRASSPHLLSMRNWLFFSALQFFRAPNFFVWSCDFFNPCLLPDSPLASEMVLHLLVVPLFFVLLVCPGIVIFVPFRDLPSLPSLLSPFCVCLRSVPRV